MGVGEEQKEEALRLTSEVVGSEELVRRQVRNKAYAHADTYVVRREADAEAGVYEVGAYTAEVGQGRVLEKQLGEE